MVRWRCAQKCARKSGALTEVELLRIGNKLISRSRIDRRIGEMLQLRLEGKSQQETADALGLDRAFVSRVEALGEVRKGGRVALVGFPIRNKAELERAALDEGVDFTFVLTEAERQEFAARVSGAALINEIMEMSARLRTFDTVLFLGSDMRLEMVESMIGRDVVVGVPLGKSPLTADVSVDVDAVVALLRGLKSGSKE